MEIGTTVREGEVGHAVAMATGLISALQDQMDFLNCTLKNRASEREMGRKILPLEHRDQGHI